MKDVLDRGRYYGKLVGQRDHGAFSIQVTRYEAGERLPVHAHALPYVCFVLEGDYRERSGFAERACETGTAIVHWGGSTHSDTFGESGGTCLNVAWNARGGASLVHRCGRALTPGAWSAPRVADLAAALADAATANGAESEELVLARLAELCEETRPGGTRAARDGDACIARETTEPRWLAAVERSIDDAVLDVDVGSLARAAGVHRTTLLRAFWRHRGTSVSEALRYRRLDRAVRAIRSGGGDLAEVAVAAGFADQSHLCRSLRAIAGTSPGKLRAASRDA